MLEDILVDPAAIGRHRSYPLGAHVDAFSERLAGLGYSRATIRYKLWIIVALSRWMADAQVAAKDLDERSAEAFTRARQQSGRTSRSFRSTVLQFIEVLRSEGVVAPCEPARDDSPGAVLLGRYEQHLRRERALAPITISTYRRFVEAFIREGLGDGLAPTDDLDAAGVRAFLLAHIPRMTPRYGQILACALRSFLRFLFQREETATDLSRAIPSVRQRRFVDVPRYVPAQDVERLLEACDRSSPTGRRDYALLLLLARLGLRAGEVLALELDDLRWREGEIVVRGKGAARDRLPLLPDVGAALALYLQKDRPSASSRRVFLCMRAPHRGFSHPSSVSTVVARAFARAGLEPACRGAHTLRHSLATTMVRRGASLTEIAQVLRHRSPATTEIYARLDFDALREVALPWPTAGAEQ